MEQTVDSVAPPEVREVPMVEAEAVRRMRALAAQGWGSKRIAQELGLARNTVRRYLRGGEAAEVQLRPAARRLGAAESAAAVSLFDGAAERNAVVVARLLADQGVAASVRTVQRAVAGRRRELRARDLATLRFETAPGRQLQVDFGQRRVWIAGVQVVVHFLVAVLGHSRRIFVKAFLCERQDDWLEGIAAAFRHFGGVPQELLGDNSRCLVREVHREAGTVVFQPAYLAFCRDWGVTPRACRPYRARTKGKTEAGVKYVKRNAIAGRRFESFAALEAHLARWMAEADQRVHGTTGERPADLFERAERAALQPLPARPLPTRVRRLRRTVSNDCLVDVDSVRYSVPHALVGERVEVEVREVEVGVYFGAGRVALHARSFEPGAMVRDPSHFEGLWRAQAPEPAPPDGSLAALGRSLADYAAVVGEAA